MQISEITYNVKNVSEQARLAKQNELFLKFEEPIYQKVIKEVGIPFTVLDFGSNDGQNVVTRLGTASRIVGLEFDKSLVQRANELRGSAGTRFFQCDLGGNTLDEIIENIDKAIAEYDVKEFDIINISMLLLHVQRPDYVVQAAYHFLKDSGVIIIKDIDDRMNIAYPDIKRHFERTVEICRETPNVGNRHTGGAIFSFLQQAGFSNITAELNGITSIGLDENEKDALFHVYHDFVEQDTRTMAGLYSNNKEFKNNADYIQKNLKEMYEEFMNPEFFYQIGIMMFSARK